MSDKKKQKLQDIIIEDLTKNKAFYTNEIINALKISNALLKGFKNVTLVAPMQSGKTGSVNYLCNRILPALGFLRNDQTVCFTTSMRDRSLHAQNRSSLEGYASNIIINKIDRYKRVGLNDTRFYNYGLMVRDEDQYGSGKESTFDKSFFSNLRKVYKKMPLVSVSATPYDIMDAKNNGFNVSVVKGERSKDYFGITEMLDEGLVEDLPKDYQHFKPDNDGKTVISEQIKKCCLILNSSKKGLGIIRCNTTNEAISLKDQLKTLTKNNIETIVVGCRKECDMTIEEGLNKLPFLIERQNKKVLLLVINALSAGKDLKELKEHVRCVIEIKKRQLANIAQGLPGRICGYHKNRDIKVFACKKVLEHFSEFERNPNIIEDDSWTNKLLYDENIKALSTQTKLESQIRKGEYRPVLDVKKYSIERLFDSNIEKELEFVSIESINKIIGFFHKEYYDKNKVYIHNRQKN